MPASDQTSKCKLHPVENSTIFPNANPYGGIPTNLFINFASTAIIVLMFLILRKSSWKLINKIVRKDEIERWTHVFFSFTAAMLSTKEEDEEGEHNVSPKDLGSQFNEGELNVAMPTCSDDEQFLQSQRTVTFTQPLSAGASQKDDYISKENYCVKDDNQITNATLPESEQGPTGSIIQTPGSEDVIADADIIHEDEIKVIVEQSAEIIDSGDGVHSRTRRQRFLRQISVASGNSEQPVTFWTWLKSIFTMSDEDIQDRCGIDALQYLRFQRHIICYLTVTMVLSITVILPLNFQGNLAGNVTDFEHTTLGNLDPNGPESEYLWAHICLAFFYFPLSIIFMRRFSVDLKFTNQSLEMSRTLLIEKIPTSLCRSQEELRRYIKEAFPTCVIVDLRFAYNVDKLEIVNEKLQEVKSALDYCIKKGKLNGDIPTYPRIDVYPKHCSRCFPCFCFCCFTKTEGLEFYGEQKQLLLDEFEKTKELALKEPLGIAFITFKSYQMAKDVNDAFRTSISTCWKARPPKSSLSSILKPQNWNVSYAPAPEDIYWENLGSRRFFLIKYIAANVLLFIFLLFLSTPAELVTQLNALSNDIGIPSIDQVGKTLQLPPAIANFLPTLIIWSFTAVLPLLVSWSDRFLGHWTRSEENHAIMKKSFWYLVFMVILLPTFGFTSINGVVTVFFGNTTESFPWECIFLPDSGAFFVNYLITAAMIGCGMELIRLPELLYYMMQICWSRSKAETPYIQSTLSVYEFRFGEQYARMMMLFCMDMLYSITCPLITPFGLLYFITKHFVDRHNLLYAYKPSKINKKVHSTGINFVILSTVMLQFFMMLFSLLRNGSWDIDGLQYRTILSILLFLLSINIYSSQLWSDTCKKFSPIDYVESTYIRDDLDEHKKSAIYVPLTLMNDDEKTKFLMYKRRRDKCISRDSEYGTF